MACSSSSNNSMMTQNSSSFSPTMTLTRKYYDVFVSFRGTDTRLNFTDHLFAALHRKGVVPFRDDIKLKKGDSIAPALLRAIEGSQIFVVVFSNNYASSTWCLEELQNILHCARVSGKRILPIFCDVDPSEVRKQSGSYEEAFTRHEERFKHDSQMVQRWRTALTQVAKLSGWDIRHKPQSSEIEKIVEEIVNVLGHKFSSFPKELVGMRSPIEELEKLLLLGSVDDVRVVGICGMGGIGKTTLATVLYDRICHQFDACCYIDDISKIYRQDGPIGVQKQILNQILGDEHHQIINLYDTSNLIRRNLPHVRALIILDNVDQPEQLALDRKWLGAGSRIIITSRDVCTWHGVDVVFKVPLLNQTDSRQLFCQETSKLDHIMSSYEGLENNILCYANGLPLAIKVMGSFLFRRDVSEWRSALARWKESPNNDIMDVLRLSFDVLDNMEKEIFLHIACFFNGQEVKYVKNVLNCCGFHPDIGLRVLIDKSLVSIERNRIEMHGLLIELGRKIVQENSRKEPRKWSRLWRQEHFYNVVLENMEKHVEAIALHGSVGENKILTAEALSKMRHLRLLILKEESISGSLGCLSDELMYVEWQEYPFMYLPPTFQPNQLVKLILEHSSIRQLWEGTMYMPNLRTLNLRHSKNLIQMPDFGGVRNLERLNLEGCVKLVQMDPSISLLRKLIFINISGCSSVFKFSTWKWMRLLPFHYLYPTPGAHKDLLPFLPTFSFLRELDISFCGLSRLPDAIGCIRWLERLNLGGNNFVALPSLKELSSLVYLNLEHCKHLESFPELPSPATTATELDHHMFSNTRNRKAGMYIFNCPKLGEKGQERCSSSMTFSWMIQFIETNQQSFAFFDVIDVVIPKSEIPRWFNNQKMGRSIRIDPSPIMRDDYFIGIACCAVFSVAPHDPAMSTTNAWGPTIRLGLKTSNVGVEHEAYIPVILHTDFVTVKSKHTWVIYFPRESLGHFLSCIGETTRRDIDYIKMAVSVMDGEDLEVVVKTCGYRWVYIQDVQEFNLTMIHGRQTSVSLN